MQDLKIRQYLPADSKAVFDLHNAALLATGAHVGNGEWDSDLSDIENVYVKNGGLFLVGLIDGKIVAMGALKKVSSERAEIKRMRVLPEFQRKGFGQAILDVLEKEARAMGYTGLCLDTTILQVAAQKMYLKNGYTEIKRTKEGFPFETLFYEKKL